MISNMSVFKSELDSFGIVLLLLNIVILVSTTLFLAIIPTITRKAFLFGVRVPENVHDRQDVKGLKSSYITTVALGGAVLCVLAIVQYIVAPRLSIMTCMYFPLIIMAVQMLAFIPQWKKARALKENNQWGVAPVMSVETRSAAQRERLTAIPWGYYAFSVGLCLIAVAISVAAYPSAPDKIPTHWNFQMQPNAWADKSMLTVLALPLVGMALVASFALSNIMIYRSKLQISTENPALSFAQHKVYRKMLSHALGVLTVATTMFCLVLQPMTLNLFVPPTWFMVGLTFALIVISIVPFLYIAIKAGQGGGKLHPQLTGADFSRTGADATFVHPKRSDDRFWKLGLFYYNPDDPSVLVEDRFGMNVGFNYATTIAKILVGSLTVLTVGIYIFITWLYFV